LKTKIRKVTVFYWLISITLVAWCFAMLYIYSWRSSWAGKIVLEETVKKEERALRDKVRILEEMAAPDHDIVEARIALAKVLFSAGDYNGARYIVDEADARLESSKIGDDQDVLAERVVLNKLAALSFRESGLYPFAQERYEKIAKLLSQNNDLDNFKGNSQARYLKLILLNEQAVLHYIWANSSKEDAERKKHFALAESLFRKCSAQSRLHLNDVDGAKYRHLEALTQANLSELLSDLKDKHGV
jgi:hypothetical protein